MYVLSPRKSRQDLPVLRDVEGPVEVKMHFVIVIDELRFRVVVAASHHPRGGLLFLD